jgi:SAM-dependent methyltransferase
MYDELARFWHVLSPPADYAEEADTFVRIYTEALGAMPRTLLELGSGGGNVASHLKKHSETTLVDLSEGMLAVSRALNPECAHAQGDMRTVRLGRTFDAVLVHDAIMYMTTEPDLRAAIESAAVHCAPGGLALFVPDCVKETFAEATDTGGGDEGGTSVRYFEWSYDPDPDDTTFETDYVIIVREGRAPSRVVHDHHVVGAFPRATWIALLSDAGFTPRVITDVWGRDLFACRRV